MLCENMCGKVVEIFKASEKRTAIFLSVYDFGLDESTTIFNENNNNFLYKTGLESHIRHTS